MVCVCVCKFVPHIKLYYGYVLFAGGYSYSPYTIFKTKATTTLASNAAAATAAVVATTSQQTKNEQLLLLSHNFGLFLYEFREFTLLTTTK